jgi:hypothetical protein
MCIISFPVRFTPSIYHNNQFLVVEYKRAQDTIGKEFHVLAKSLADQEQGVHTMLGDIKLAKSLTDAVEHCQLDYTNYAKHVSSVHMLKIANLRSELIRQYKQFKSETELELKSVSKDRKETLQSFEKYQKSFDLVRVKKSTSQPSVDPWIAAKLATRQVEKALAHENQVQKKLLAIHQRVLQFEVKLVADLKSVLMEFMDGVRQTGDKVTCSLSSLRGLADSVNPQVAFDRYCDKHKLNDPECFHKQMTVEAFPWMRQADDANEIKKEGILHRQGNFKKSNFKRSLYVLTENGFLHCFPAKTASQSWKDVKTNLDAIDYSIYLRTPKLLAQRSSKNVNCLEIVDPIGHQGWFSRSPKTYVIKADSEKELNVWLEALGDFLAMNRDPPVVEKSDDAVESPEQMMTVEQDEAEKAHEMEPESKLSEKPLETKMGQSSNPFHIAV